MLEPLWKWLDALLWGTRSFGRDPLALVLRVARYPFAILRDLSRGEVNLRAMGLVYTTLLTVIPLLAFSFAILKVFGQHRDLEPIVYEFFRPLGRSATDLTARVMQFADKVSSGLVGSVGLALLLYTLLGTIQRVEDSFNFVWRVEHPRSFARRVGEYLSLLVLGPLALVGFLGLAHAAMTSSPVQQIAGVPLVQRLLVPSLATFAPYVMVTVLFTALYMYVPNTRVRLRAAAIGGLAAGVLWAAVGQVFTALVVYTTRLTIVYAGFAFIVAALLWTYLGWVILLAGARLAFYVQNPQNLRLGLVELRLSSVETERLALQIMYLVGLAHVRGAARWSVPGLSSELGLPGIAISQVVDALEAAGLVTGDERERLLPGRDIGHISLREILEVARNHRSGHVEARRLSLPAVDRVADSLARSWQESCGSRTLRELVEDPIVEAGGGAVAAAGGGVQAEARAAPAVR
jgi:membrane protein